jgi:DNA polymerase-3 subunit gamma/tau
LFSEEDLTRFLNIVLRTHDELGYRQEQRFHLELGMLKMVHAHRLLPLEEFLSQANATAPATPSRSVPAAAPGGSQRLAESKVSSPGALRPQAPQPISSGSSATPSRVVSPFEADRLRKIRSSEPEGSVAASISDSGIELQTRGSLAVAAVAGVSAAVALAEAPEVQSVIAIPKEVNLDDLRSSLIGVLEAQSQDTAADLLARGEWKFEGHQLSLRLPLSDKVIDLSLSADARRLLTQEASRLCGRPIKLNIAGGGVAQNPVAHVHNGNGNGNGAGGARQRAAEDPIVRRMQEKFGAEVRTVVDLRKK